MSHGSLSPLRYIGSKFRLGKQLNTLSMPTTWSRYIEVFGGGGHFLWNYIPTDKTRWFNDINPDVASVFETIRDDAAWVRETGEWWDGLKADPTYLGLVFHRMIARFREGVDPLAYLFLSRFSAGCFVRRHRRDIASYDEFWVNKVGGVTSKSLLRLHEKAQGVKISLIDFREFLTIDDPQTLMYYDPPYCCSVCCYEIGFSYRDHIDLCRGLKRARHRFILTVGNSPVERELYGQTDFQSPFREQRGFRVYEHHYAMGATPRRSRTRPRTSELIILNYD